MQKTKRLFLFAGYNAAGKIDDALVLYVRALSRLGDVVLTMDSTCNKTQTKKLRPFVLHVAATRHGEYDFGSYKRDYIWARDNLDLSKYDYIYMVNDSVFGPLGDIRKTIHNIESVGTDAAGIIVTHHKTHAYMESWFVRLNKKIFKSVWFAEFLSSVSTQPTKARITIEYEHGLSKLIQNNNCSWGGIYHYYGRYTYNHPKKIFNRGCPFIKKACFIRHNGAAGAQIKYILSHCDVVARRAIIKSANELYGEKYMNWLLTYNPLKIMYRNIRYGLKKLKDGGI
jgi:lipopolysaccharide biosynthesis protein